MTTQTSYVEWDVEYRDGEGLWVVDKAGGDVAFVQGPAERTYLVAAAPKMLQALEDVAEWVSHGKGCPARGSGECMCVRSTVLDAIDAANGP